MSVEVKTFGCRLNHFESQVIRDLTVDLSNTIVINSCAVTAEAERQLRQELRKIKRIDPKKRIVLTGCAAQIDPKKYESMPEVDMILGNKEKLLRESYNKLSGKYVGDIMSLTSSPSKKPINYLEGKVRGFIEIQNGCNHRCTFCIIPYGRGNSRSESVSSIVEQVTKLVQQGCKEVVFTGVDITGYGEDFKDNIKLSDLVKRVLNNVPDLQRLRLSSVDVAEIDEELFSMLVREKKIMPHMHLSLQSGDNIVLKRMKRRHTPEQVIEFCISLKNARKEMTFGADLIAGFPTENKEMFDNTCNLIKKCGISHLHIFPYSPREGTPASRMPQVINEVKKERAAILRSMGREELLKLLNSMLGKKVNVLMESSNEGRSENFLKVKIIDSYVKKGEVYEASVSGIDGEYLLGEIDSL